jgi:hypothetical protein
MVARARELLQKAAVTDKQGREEADTGKPPAHVLELALGCVRFVEARYGVALDFDPDTLGLLDQWVSDARDAEGGEHGATSGEVSPGSPTVELVQAAAGAYLGEVIRRQFGGTWHAPEGFGTWADWRVCLAPVYCAFNPIGMAREALTLEPQDGWHAHFELDPAEADAVHARLAALPEVGEKEYYAPSTRYDVVCIVVEALRESMRARGLGDVAFTAEDYADGLPPRQTLN